MKPEDRIEIKKSIEEKISQLTEDIEILKEHMKPGTYLVWWTRPIKWML